MASEPRTPAVWVSSPEGVDSRGAFRKEMLDRIPPRYSPALHIAGPAIVGLALIAGAIASIRGLRWWELVLVPVVYVTANAVEHRAHKHALHHRRKPLEILFDRHTPIHHRIFTAGDMAVRSPRELALVLLPSVGIVAIFAMTAPVTLALWLTERNMACLFVVTTMSYVLSYEWLHLSYHLPPTHFIGRLALVRVLRRHHATHHHPPLMQKWNFNVTVPLWDWVRGTTYRGPLPMPTEPESSRSVSMGATLDRVGNAPP